MGTVEAALALVALVAVTVLCLAGVTALLASVRCTDAAREAARLAARGDPAATAAAQTVAPAGARVQVHRDGGYVVATVTSRSPLLPVTISGRAVAAVEPAMSG